MVPLAFEDFFEATDSILDADIAAFAAGEDFGDEHRLREEALDPARSRNGLLVLLGELFGAENGDDVLEVSVALKDSLYAAGRVVVLFADDARVEDARERGERVDGGVEGLLDERAEEIDVARAEEARRRAEQQLERRETDVDLARVSAELQKALVRLKVAERRRRRTGTRPGPPGV